MSRDTLLEPTEGLSEVPHDRWLLAEGRDEPDGPLNPVDPIRSA
ncbi:MAG TPA: hypothetical protein VLA60_00735 [Nitrospirales bacterium]|nr:hypothetical protein [Nitrospirales bacterium]